MLLSAVLPVVLGLFPQQAGTGVLSEHEVAAALVAKGETVALRTLLREKPRLLYSRDRAGVTLLMEAGKANVPAETFAMLLAAGADPNTPDNDFSVAAHYVLSSWRWGEFDRRKVFPQQVAKVRSLLAKGRPSFFNRNRHRTYPAEFAVGSRSLEMVRPLLAAGVVPPSAVLSAGSVPMLRLLVSYKFRATVRGPGGDTALHGAASWGARKELLRELVRLGVPVDARDDKGQTPLFLASFRLWTVKDLLALGANADARDFTGGSVLHFSYVKEPTMIRALISGGANVNGKDFEGNQPLHIRLRNATLGPDGIESAVSALLGSGARVNDANWWGETSLISLGLSDAPDDKATRLVSALLRKGANVRARDKQGRTALHLVTGRVEMTTALLAARADPNAPDANGDTPLHRVVETRFPTHIEQLEVARRLIIAGADPLRPNHEGRTPLANASGCNSESRALFELLRKSAGPARTNLGD